MAEEVESRGRRCPAPYYPDPLALYYAVARGVALGVEPWRRLGPVMVEDISARHASGGLASPLERSLALVTLASFDGPAGTRADLAEELTAEQRADGSWERATYYGGPFDFWGSEELTTALALEALAAG